MVSLLIVGGIGGTNIGESFQRAAEYIGIKSNIMDHAEAFKGPILLRKLSWHLLQHRPCNLESFSRRVLEISIKHKPNILISTGSAPIKRCTLQRLREKNILCVNFSTDDPWNPVHRAKWYQAALPYYNMILTPRRANIEDFRKLGCTNVHYFPFGFDSILFSNFIPSINTGSKRPEILFAGGADQDRVDFFDIFIKQGFSPMLVGDYWERYPETRAYTLGYKSINDLLELTVRASINICIVRKANRDGHVMRSFEIPAVRGFMIAEDTEEHRELFGPEGDCVLYFSNPKNAAEKVKWALLNPEACLQMAEACYQSIVVSGQHTYIDRLKRILELQKY